jgi:hypothetical protein
MAKMQVDVDSVRVMAGRWHTQAAELGTGAPPMSGLPSQTSAAAVNTGHADIAAAAATLTERVHTTATKVTEAGARYTTNEVNSAGLLAAVAEPVTAD